jgi:GT2 family glycosyltransferase
MLAIVKFEHGDCAKALDAPPFGANMAFRRRVFEKYGLFRVDLGPGYRGLAGGEDTAVGRRVMSAGEKVVYAPEALVFHPVEEYRTQRKYYEAWYVKFGRASIRSEQWKPGTRCYFGVPRYLFRQLAEEAFRWAVSLGGKRRFYYKLQVCSTAGSIREARQIARGAALQAAPRWPEGGDL